MTLGPRIQESRMRLGLSQEALGEKLGVSRQAVSKWEADAAVPDTDKLIALSKLFGLTLNQLLQVEGPEGASPAAEHVSEEPEDDKGKNYRIRRLLPVLAVLALVLGLTAMTVSFGRMAGQISDRITRLELRVNQLEAASALDPADLVGSWEVRSDSDVTYYEADTGYYQKLLVTVALSRYDPEQDIKVFFQSYGPDTEGSRVSAAQKPGTEGVYYAQIPVSQSGGETVAVGFQIDGVDYLQPLARILKVSDNTIYYDTLLE